MQIKRFEARDMATALRKVKKEFGEQAVILSAKTIKHPGGIFGSRQRKGVEITAASDRFPKQDQQTSPGFKTVIPAAVPDPDNPLGTELPVKTIPAPKPEQRSTPPAHRTADSLSTVVSQSSEHDNVTVQVPKPGPELEKFKQALLAQDVSTELAVRMTHRISSELDAGAVGVALDQRFRRLLKEQLVFAEPGRSKKGAPRVIALVGPSGVGKTTTTAKLAATASTYEGARVGLISLDHQRIGGTAQLEVLAQVMELPLIIIRDKAELKVALSDFQSLDIILVDTPGISANRTQDLKKLDLLLRPLQPDEVHLLLSAATKDRDLHLLAEQFNRVGYNRLIFTKLDETAAYGNLLNLMTANKTPLAYLTDGPKVPGDLKAATADAVIELFALETDAKTRSTDLSLDNAPLRPPKLGRNEVPPVQQNYFVANRNSDIFHRPDCKSVKRINPDNILVFKNMGEAKAQNFKPCRMCCAMRISKRPAFETFRLKAVGS